VLGVPTIRKFIVCPFFSLSEIMKHLLGQEGEEEEEDEVGPAQIPRKTNQTDHLSILRSRKIFVNRAVPLLFSFLHWA
jgi:hypothetical protein